MNTNKQQPQCKLSILHFNDVYDIQPDSTQPKGGAAYFKTMLDKYRQPHTLTMFSGDAFSPALLSSLYKGQNMIKPLNSYNIDIACLGNHDLDYPIQHVQILKNKTNFPWLLSNVINKNTGQRLVQCQQYKIIQKNGYKIGIFSLAEKQWIDTLIPSYKQNIQYIPWQQYTDYMLKQLKSQNCNIIIALTHMMRYNDIKLAEKYNQIDLILGGHDHLVVHQKINNSILVKSGTNFKNFSYIQIYPNQNKYKQNIEKGQCTEYQQKYIFNNQNYIAKVTLVQINHSKANILPNQQLNNYVNQIYSKFKDRQQKIGCYFLQAVDLRFKSIRKQQNAYLQFLVSLYRHYTKAQCAFMNSGNFRADSYIPAGPVTFGLLTNIIEDQIIVKKVTGQRVLQGLQNCVSMYPNLSGRYSTFSGIQFVWDCSKKPYQRVLANKVKINGKPLKLQKIYRVAMHGFVSQGGDGFTAFKDCPIDHDQFHKSNLLLVNDLLDGNQKLLTGYPQKYPGRLSYKFDQNGKKILILHVPNPKNVHMIDSSLPDYINQEIILNRERTIRYSFSQKKPPIIINTTTDTTTGTTTGTDTSNKIIQSNQSIQSSQSIKTIQQLNKQLQNKLKLQEQQKHKLKLQQIINSNKQISLNIQSNSKIPLNFNDEQFKKSLLRKMISTALQEQQRKNSQQEIDKDKDKSK